MSYLEIGPSWPGDSYKILLQNTGIGPAFIRDVYVKYGGERHELDLFGFLSEFSTPEDGIGSMTYSSIYPGRVLQGAVP